VESELTGICGIITQRRGRANGEESERAGIRGGGNDTEESQSELTGESGLTGIYEIMIQRGVRANGYLWDYDTEESQS
ncbi:hypothetical protein RRG08_041682, partial [Elysia crispata]